MNPKLVEIEPFNVAGVSVRTTNAAETSQETSKIGPLWGEFFGKGIGERIAGTIPDSLIYGVYSAYESDMNGAYMVTVGRQVASAEAGNEDLTRVEIQPGAYLVFEEKGAMPQAVVAAWHAVWDYFAKNPDVQRRYTTDFEAYTGMEEVAIHIAVTRE